MRMEASSKASIDVLAGGALLKHILRSTQLPTLRIAPARGSLTPIDYLEREGDELPHLLTASSRLGDIVIVDCPAGMFGTTRKVLEVATHVLGVLQAETISSRSFHMLGEAVQPSRTRAEMLGIVANMVNVRSNLSAEAIRLATSGSGTEKLLFRTVIPRTDAFDRAAHAAAPLDGSSRGKGSGTAFLFDMLASEVADRLALRDEVSARSRPFLL
jgi:cellulose biosynthesis protein BcsQ